jgi:hypothetical protein
MRRTVVERGGGHARPALDHRPLAFLDAAQRGADDDGDPCGIGGQRGAREQIVGGQRQQRRRAAARQPSLARRAQLLDLAAAPHAQIVDAEAFDGRNAIDAGAERRPERVEIQPERRRDTGRDDDGARPGAPHAGGLQTS